MVSPCIFCGQKADSREHAIPKWIGKRLGLAKEELQLVLAEESQPVRRHQPVVFGTHRARIFCSACNRHFKGLEDEAADLVTWMARGRAISLGACEQDILARWGAKTAIAILATAGDEFADPVPWEHRRVLREENRVHPCISVGYGSWVGNIHRAAIADPLEYEPDDDGTSRSYMVVLTFAQLALQVFGVDPIPEGKTLSLDRQLLVQVAPPLSRSISWPTPPINDAHLLKFVNEQRGEVAKRRALRRRS